MRYDWSTRYEHHICDVEMLEMPNFESDENQLEEVSNYTCAYIFRLLCLFAMIPSWITLLLSALTPSGAPHGVWALTQTEWLGRNLPKRVR